jgi:hypothetical protein
MPTPSTAPAFGDADIPALLADTGVAVTVGAVAGIGLLDEADEIIVQDVNRGGVVMLASTLTVQTSAFPTVKIGDAVVIGTANFTVRERLREGDGGLTKLLLGSGPVVPQGGAAPNNVIDGGTF